MQLFTTLLLLAGVAIFVPGVYAQLRREFESNQADSFPAIFVPKVYAQPRGIPLLHQTDSSPAIFVPGVYAQLGREPLPNQADSFPAIFVPGVYAQPRHEPLPSQADSFPATFRTEDYEKSKHEHLLCQADSFPATFYTEVYEKPRREPESDQSPARAWWSLVAERKELEPNRPVLPPANFVPEVHAQPTRELLLRKADRPFPAVSLTTLLTKPVREPESNQSVSSPAFLSSLVLTRRKPEPNETVSSPALTVPEVHAQPTPEPESDGYDSSYDLNGISHESRVKRSPKDEKRGQIEISAKKDGTGESYGAKVRHDVVRKDNFNVYVEGQVDKHSGQRHDKQVGVGLEYKW